MAKRRSEVGVKSVVDEIAAEMKASIDEGAKRRAEYDQMNKDLDKAWGGPDPKPAVTNVVNQSSPQRARLTVVWGEEYFQPVQYNGFKVGPFSLEVDIQQGVTVEATYHAAWIILDQLARKQFDEKLDAYLDRLQQMGERVEARKR